MLKEVSKTSDKSELFLFSALSRDGRDDIWKEIVRLLMPTEDPE